MTAEDVKPMADQTRAGALDDGHDNGRDTIARLTAEMLPTLIERLTNSDLGELEVRENGWRIRLRRPITTNGQSPATTPAIHRPIAVSAQSASDLHPTPHAARKDPPRGLVTSPAVGYFAPREGVEVGANVRKGDLLGHVDVLGVRQEVTSPIDGVLRGLEVEPGQAVEYGQPIGRVEANV